MVERYRPAKVDTTQNLRPIKKGEFRGRHKGVPNKLTMTIKSAIEGAGNDLGELEPVWSSVDRRGNPKPGARIIWWKATGRDGLQGYLRSLAIIKPSAYAGLIGRLLPHTLNVQAKIDATVRSRFEGIDLGNKSMNELMALYREAVGMTQPLPELPSPGSMIDLEAEAVSPDSADAFKVPVQSSNHNLPPPSPPVVGVSGPEHPTEPDDDDDEDEVKAA